MELLQTHLDLQKKPMAEPLEALRAAFSCIFNDFHAFSSFSSLFSKVFDIFRSWKRTSHQEVIVKQLQNHSNHSQLRPSIASLLEENVPLDSTCGASFRRI